MAQAGHSLVEIAKILGHATTATADRYMHLSPSHLRSAVQALEAVLGPTATQTATNSASPNPAKNDTVGSVMIPTISATAGR